MRDAFDDEQLSGPKGLSVKLVWFFDENSENIFDHFGGQNHNFWPNW